MEPRYSTGDAAELGAQLAGLAKGNFPLPPALRALAAEFPRRRVARALVRVAERIEAGTPLNEALAAEGRSFPPHIRGLIEAGLRTGRLAEALEEFVSIERNRGELRQRVRLSMAYPAVLFIVAAAIIALFSAFVIPQFEQIFRDFGADLPHITTAFLWTARHGGPNSLGIVVVVVLALALVRITGRPVAVQRGLYMVPVIGPLWRWSGLADFSRLMALMIDQQLPLPEAFRLTAAGVRRPDLSVACREAARRAERGVSLAENLDQDPAFPPTLRAAVRSVQDPAAVAESFRSAAQMFEGRTKSYSRLLEIVAAPIMFTIVIGFVGFMIVALVMPLVGLIQKLS